ncbi:MAG TPA: GntR family transcriptional regulator [Burkholderiales bacterium]|nr:GntR family transcriptional regulator [Burkholderiales bacterium]
MPKLGPASAHGLSETLPAKIAGALAEGIVSGRYQPGERLVEAALVKEFGVSHGPVRDALRILQSSGLVHIHPYRGGQVSALSVREVKEIYQVRAALVGLRARWIAEDPDRAGLIAQVEASVERLSELAPSADAAGEYIGVALSLNRMLTENLSNRWLRSMLQALTLQTSRYTRLALATAERRAESARLWRTLVDAIKGGDGDGAEAIASTISLATRDAAIRSLQERDQMTLMESATPETASEAAPAQAAAAPRKNQTGPQS